MLKNSKSLGEIKNNTQKFNFKPKTCKEKEEFSAKETNVELDRKHKENKYKIKFI